MSSAAADQQPATIDVVVQFRMPTRRAADQVAGRIARDHDARIVVSRSRRLGSQAGWSVFVRLPETRIGLERIRQMTEGFAELAEKYGGEMVWEATRPRRARPRR